MRAGLVQPLGQGALPAPDRINATHTVLQSVRYVQAWTARYRTCNAISARLGAKMMASFGAAAPHGAPVQSAQGARPRIIQAKKQFWHLWREAMLSWDSAVLPIEDQVGMARQGRGVLSRALAPRSSSSCASSSSV